MSEAASITLFWADKEYEFRIAIGQFRELQENINGRRIAIGAQPLGPSGFLQLLKANDGWPDDVRDVLRLGLIGAGMKPADAHHKMIRHFDKSPLLEHSKPAFLVLLTAMVGPVGDDIAKKKTIATETTNPSSSPQSTAPVLQ